MKLGKKRNHKTISSNLFDFVVFISAKASKSELLRFDGTVGFAFLF